jgi:fimbrial isopeptide formation D2 family protein/uncharacterized repeat protein (TIGR01451 family)
MAADGNPRQLSALFVPLEDRIVLDGIPEVTISGPDPLAPAGTSTVDIGSQDVPFTLTFDNVGSSSGFVPYVDLILPSGSDGDDGVSFDSASFLGAPIPTTEIVFDAAGQAVHPVATDNMGNPLIVSGMPGDTLVVFELPYGSFSPGNPAVDIDVLLDFSDLADLSDDFSLQAIGGFALGCDPLDNPMTDNPVRGTPVDHSVSQQLFEVTKINNVPEADAATGPNYPYQYEIEIDVAAGQTLSNFTLTDNLPPSIVYLGNLNISGGAGTVVTEPPVGTQVAAPNDQVVIDFATVSNTITVTFDYFISDAPSTGTGPLISPTTGDETDVVNQVTGSGDWVPLDPRDPTVTVSDSDTNVQQARSIGIQKTFTPVMDIAPAGATPNDVYEFTLNVQVSDYFTYGDIVVTDILGNGWDYVDGSASYTYVETGGGNATAASLTAFEMSSFNAGTGETTNVWDISAALIAAGDDGILTGDIAADGIQNGSTTTVQITYQATVQDQFSAGVPGNVEIGQGDALLNNANIAATVRDNANPGTVVGTEDDTTSARIDIPFGAIRSKEVYALNGDPAFDPTLPIAAGDTVTFRFIYDAPLGSFEMLNIVDNLPQNVFDANEFTVFNPIVSGAPPAAGQAHYGPGDQFFNNSGGLTPTVTADPPNNGLNFDFSDLSVDPRQPIQIEVLFTVTVIDSVFAPDLLLTNQATAFETNSFGDTVDTTAIAQFTYSEPVLEITKGAIATDSADPNAAFTAGQGPVAFTAPGSAGPRWAGTINSNGLDATPVDANLDNIDAGDLVTFAIVIENTGLAPNGAFNIDVTDTLPAGFVIPTTGAGLNLSVTDGTGTRPITFTGAPADLFGAGITLDDRGIEGSLSAFDPTAGDNIVVITYDLLVEDTLAGGAALTNTAAVANFSALEGDPMNVPVNRVPAGGLMDDAVVTTEEPQIDKTLLSREFGEGAANQLLVGEEVSYLIRVDVSEGTFDNAIISDAVTAGGLELIGAEIVTFGNNMSSSNMLGIMDTAVPVGNTVSFDFGTLTNAGDNDQTNDFIEIRVDARVPDNLAGSAGEVLRNVATFDYTGGSVSDALVNRLIEPNLSLDKSATPATVAAGGQVDYSVVVTNNPATFDAPAFDLVLSDTLDSNLTLIPGSIQILLNGSNVTGNAGFTVNPPVGNAFTVDIAQLDEGDTIEVVYSGTVTNAIPAGVVIPNTANLTYDSTPDDEPVGSGVGGDSDDRDYSLTDDAQVIAQSPGLTKTVVATSNPDTLGSDLAINETVTYEIVAQIPEGTVDSVVITDVLPTLPGGTLQYVSSEIVRIGDAANTNISGLTLPAVGSAGVNSGATTTFTFGDLSNTFDGVTNTADEIVIRVTALLVDNPANAAGDTLTNTSTLDFIDGNGMAASTSDTADIDVVEPSLDLGKTVVPTTGDAGDVVTYTVTSVNNGDGPAYDIIIDDALADPGLTSFEPGAGGILTIQILDAGGADITPIPPDPDAPTVTWTAGALQAVVPELLPGQEIVITYQATVTDAALFSSTLPNTAELTRFDSDPAGDETQDNGRVYDAGLAGYTPPTATANVSTPDASLTKTFVGGSDPNTAGADLVVGEIATYELVITVPQGTADLTLTDVMPVGLSAQSATFVAVNNAPSGFTSDITVGATQSGIGTTGGITIGAAGDNVTFDFGTVINSGANNAAATDTQIVVQITALVEDVLPQVADGQSLVNSATLDVNDPVGGAPLQPDPTASDTVDIVEPNVTVAKTALIAGNPGDIVPYEVTLTNTGTGPAYDLVLTDTLSDPDLTLETGTVQVFLAGTNTLLVPAPVVVETAPDGFTVSGIDLLPGQAVDVRYSVELSPAAPDAQSFPNTASVVYDTVSDGDPMSPTGRSDTASDTATIATVPRVTKEPVSSNFTETDSVQGSSPFQLNVGEEVTYRYTLTLPEIAMDSVVLADALPPGMVFVSSAVVPTPGGLPFAGAPMVTVDPNQRDVTFDFGPINNPSDGSIGADDVLTFEVTARVVDDAAATAGATLTNTVDLTVTPQGQPPLSTQTTSADVSVVEPLLTLDKTGPTALARGATGDFQITVTNTGPTPATAGPAYDVIIADTLPTDLALDPGSIVVRLDGAVIAPTVTTTATGFSLSVPVVDVNSVVTVDYQATLSATAAALQGVTNTATADFDSAPGANPDERAGPQASDTHTLVTDPTLVKNAISTGDPNTGSGEFDPAQLDATVGETVTYEMILTLPEVDMTSAVLTDTLPANLTFVSASVDSIGAGLSVGSSTVTNTGQTVTYDFQNIVRTSVDGIFNADDQIRVLLTAVVNTDPANVAGTEITNTSTLNVNPVGAPPLNPSTATADIDVVFPELVADKTGTIALAPGDTASYTATFTNTGTAPAYDAFIEDTLGDPFLSLNTGTVTAVLNGVDVTADLTINETATGFDFVLFDTTNGVPLPILPGESLVVSYDATLSASAPDANSFPNTISADFDTVGDGDPASPGAGTGTASDPHSVATVPFVEKTPISSTFSETDSTAGSTPFQLAIGEEVTYRYDIFLPEIDLDSVVISDLLPAGLTFVSATATDFGGMTTQAGGAIAQPIITTSGQLITLDFGDVTNPFDGAIGPDDVITLELTAVVTDIPTNTAGGTLTNTVSLDVDPANAPPFPTRTTTADVELVEPLLTVDKNGPLLVNPGDPVNYSLTIVNTGPTPATAGPAYDVTISDSLPAEIALDPTSLVFTLDGMVITPTVTATAGGFSTTIPVIDAGSTLEVTYSGTLSPTATIPQSFTNSATVGYDSAPGVNPNERTYTPIIDSHPVATPPTLTKDILSTSIGSGSGQHDPNQPDVLIGELITYQLVMTVPQIPMDAAVLTDTLDAGLSFVSADIVSVGADISGVTANDEATVVGVAGQVVTFNFGAITNTFDGTINADDQIVVNITARVEDLPTVNDGDMLTNNASFTITPEGGTPTAPVLDAETVDVVEPTVSIDKAVSDAMPMQGDTITYTLVVTNDAAATGPALNLLVSDPLPANLSLTGSVVLSPPALGTVTSGSGTTLLVSIPILQPGESVTITYDAFVGFATPVFTDVINTADVTGSSSGDGAGRPISDADSEIIEVTPVPAPIEDERVRLIASGIDDARFLPVLLIDPIFSGTAEPGANVTINLYSLDGTLNFVRNIVADAGGHWIAVFPQVELSQVEEDFHDEFEGSVLFDAPVKYLDDPDRGSIGIRVEARELIVGSVLQDNAYTIGLDQDRPSSLPQENGAFNARTFFAPATIGEPFGRGSVLDVDDVFERLAGPSVEALYAASLNPLGQGLNRFNYEFLTEATAVPGARN